MLFNSYQFAIYFPVVTLLYFLLGGKSRVFMLLAASCYFYMAFVPRYILILAVLILVDYSAGILIENAAGRKRKLLLITSLVANIGMLGFFKYFNFLNGNVMSLAHWIGWNYPVPDLAIILPIGLSFHTFQSMSYTIEVYRGNFKAERSLPHFALYVLFYPQLVAGPIERPQNLLHQFYEKHPFDRDRVFEGLKWIAGGLFKKIVIADRLAVLVNTVYNDHRHYSGAQLLVATYFFAIQIYCDFSGYTDIARGAARVMGIGLMRNFNHPYLAPSIEDFWKRWHISLTTWFRDYLYIPLGGNRVHAGRFYLNIAIVFLVSGLWHGANWTYVFWGGLHAVAFIFCAFTRRSREKILAALRLERSVFIRCLGVFLTFNFVCLTWVFFRARSLSQAFDIIGRIASDFSLPTRLYAGLHYGQFILSIVLIVSLLATELLIRRSPSWLRAAFQYKLVRWSAYYLFIVALVVLALLSPQQTAQTFIYFQF